MEEGSDGEPQWQLVGEKGKLTGTKRVKMRGGGSGAGPGRRSGVARAGGEEWRPGMTANHTTGLGAERAAAGAVESSAAGRAGAVVAEAGGEVGVTVTAGDGKPRREVMRERNTEPRSGRADEEREESNARVEVEGAAHGAAERKTEAAVREETATQHVVFDKELTVALELQGKEPVTVMELMRAVRGLGGGLVACRPTGPRAFEVTMTHLKGKERILDGFKIGETNVIAKGLCNNELVVSFLNLPAYITDEEILKKLDSWGVGATSLIRRRMWPGTKIADGTRFLKVKFNEKVQSLPYSARFETALGPEYFRVIHDRQVKVCRMCIQPGHILRDCPEFSCHKCGVQGHYARECEGRREEGEKKCSLCNNTMSECNCRDNESEDTADSAELTTGSESSEGEMEEDEEEMEQGVQHEKACVAVRSDLARAEPPHKSVQPEGPTQAGPAGLSGGGREMADEVDMGGGGCGSAEDLGLPSAQAPGGRVGSADTDPRGGRRQGEFPAVLPTKPEESLEADMDIEMIKQIRKRPLNRKVKKRQKTQVI